MSDSHKPIITAGDDDTVRAYVFSLPSDPTRHAVTRDPNGSNLPRSCGAGDWVFERAIALGVREAMPLPIAPEPVLRGLMANGYFVWTDHANPHGTSQ